MSSIEQKKLQALPTGAVAACVTAHTQQQPRTLERKPSRLQEMLSSAQQEIHEVKNSSSTGSWRTAALHVVHSRWVQRTLVILLFVDIIALVIELLLDTEFPRCAVVQRHAICVANGTESTSSAHELVRRSADVEVPPAAPGLVVFCLPHPDAVHGAHLALTVISMVILSLFMLELIVLIVCLGPKRFFKHVLYDVDLLIISVSLALEITVIVGVNPLQNQEVETIVVLLLLARMWRFARIIHSVFLETYDFEHERSRECRLELVHMKQKVALLEEELDRMHKDCLDVTE
jgi:hypothetical protein